MKTILVTGGAGFIGSHLTERLLAAGHRVLVVDDESTGRAANLSAVMGHERLEWIPGSIADEGLIAELIARADDVYHLAAAVGVALIAKEPIATIERNVEPTQRILALLDERHRAGHAVRFFLASTSEVYGKNPKSIWTEEDDLVFGPTTKARWSYGCSKAIDEFLCLGYRRQSGLPVVIGRFFNVVGPRQTGAYGMVLPRFVTAALKREPLQVHDDGQQIRCFAHVSDVVGAVIALTERAESAGQIYNIGSDAPVTILELAKRVLARTGSLSQIDFQSYHDAYDKDFEDIRRRVPDLSKLRAAIGFRPQYDLDAIIDQVAQQGV
ncbi:MAG: GDP-mannose 4,6-dehydratase [Planctomycetales bacterium]|nr:GDP-mannose 4,6-dehydratase [Planctomycetales bacterium]